MYSYREWFKGTDRLCKVVELSMQCCGQILQFSFETFETYTTFPRCIIYQCLSAQSTFILLDLGGYFFRISFLKLVKLVLRSGSSWTVYQLDLLYSLLYWRKWRTSINFLIVVTWRFCSPGLELGLQQGIYNSSIRINHI